MSIFSTDNAYNNQQVNTHVMTSKHFSSYWPPARGIHRSLLDLSDFLGTLMLLLSQFEQAIDPIVQQIDTKARMLMEIICTTLIQHAFSTIKCAPTNPDAMKLASSNRYNIDWQFPPCSFCKCWTCWYINYCGWRPMYTLYTLILLRTVLLWL